MKTTASLVKLSVFIVVTSVLTLMLAATIGNITLGDKTSYTARFSDVTGLLPGNDVRIAGVRVGSVESVGLDETGKTAEVRIELDEGRQIPESAVLRLRYRNLVGERYIAITEGPGSAEPLEDGGVIPLAQTRPALDLTVLFNGFRPLFQALDPKAVNDMAFEIVKTLQGEGGTIESLVARTASLTNTLADRDEVIGRVITNLGTVLETVDERDDELSRLLVEVRRLSEGFAEDRRAIGESIEGIEDLTSATASLISGVREPLREDIARLRDVATLLDEDREFVDGVLERLPRKLDTIIGTATYGSWFNFYLCGFTGQVVLPSGQTEPLERFVSNAARCRKEG